MALLPAGGKIFCVPLPFLDIRDRLDVIFAIQTPR